MSLFGDWATANLSSIQPVYGWLTNFATILISFIGLAIVVSTIAKNAIAALYATNTKLWDKVYEVKTSKLITDKGSVGGNVISVGMGTISSLFLSFLPNVKAYTDFENGQSIDPKAYFMKSVPVAVFCIFIGFFVAYGYPTKISEKLSVVGSDVIDTVLINVDPASWLDYVFTNAVKPEFTTDKTTDDYYNGVNKITKLVYTKYVGALNDMKKEMRKKIGLELETWVLDETAAYKDYFNTKRYIMASEAVVINGEQPDISRIHDTSGEDGVYQIAFTSRVDRWASGTTKNTEKMYIVFYVTFTPIATTDITAVCSNKISMPTSGWVSDGKGYSYTVNSTGGAKLVMKTSGATGSLSNSSINISVVDNTLKITSQFSTQIQFEANDTISNIQGLYYSVGGTNHPIKSITRSEGTTITFTAEDDSSLIWYFGEDPVLRRGQEGGGSSIDSGIQDQGALVY